MASRPRPATARDVFQRSGGKLGGCPTRRLSSPGAPSRSATSTPAPHKGSHRWAEGLCFCVTRSDGRTGMGLRSQVSVSQGWGAHCGASKLPQKSNLLPLARAPSRSRERLRRAAGVGRNPQGCRAPGRDPDAGEVLGGVTLALEPMTHHAIARLPRSAVFPNGCVYSAQGFSVFTQERNILSANPLRVYTYPSQRGSRG
jgi:hypothetical protein